MIITQLNGGLGNQMFQYAVARNLAIKHNTSVLIDRSLLNQGNYLKTYRRYYLDEFNISAEFANSRITKTIARQKSIIWKTLNWISKPKIKLIYEKGFGYNPIFTEGDDNLCLCGYWQSEKYFAEIRNVLLEEFTLKHTIDSLSKELSVKISEKNSVSVHFRRGDYISNPITNKVHGICGDDYYSKAMHMIESKIQDPEFFIFSDDIDWCKANIKTDCSIDFVEHNKEEDAIKDLWLMSLCKHNIIANSSFSWWGAWLNRNPNKIVIAPRKWFNNGNIETKDLYPVSWVI